MRVTPVRRQRARALRRELTPSEERLWKSLRDRRLGDYKFRRQYAIGPFVLDFYCAEVRVALEVDGRQHAAQWIADYDERRTAYLHARGIEVIRITNEDVMNNGDGIADYLRLRLAARKKNR